MWLAAFASPRQPSFAGLQIGSNCCLRCLHGKVHVQPKKGINHADAMDLASILEQIRAQAEDESIRITQHAHQEMVEENITLEEVIEAVCAGEILENYPQHRRGACCLLHGVTRTGRPLHIVCTTTRPKLIVVTVYEPRPPKWVTPTRSGR